MKKLECELFYYKINVLIMCLLSHVFLENASSIFCITLKSYFTQNVRNFFLGLKDPFYLHFYNFSI